MVTKKQWYDLIRNEKIRRKCGFAIESLAEEREFALDLSTEARGPTADPELIASLLVAEAELLELGECGGR